MVGSENWTCEWAIDCFERDPCSQHDMCRSSCRMRIALIMAVIVVKFSFVNAKSIPLNLPGTCVTRMKQCSALYIMVTRYCFKATKS